MVTIVWLLALLLLAASCLQAARLGVRQGDWRPLMFSLLLVATCVVAGVLYLDAHRGDN